jgi:hypothetical protein
VPDGLHDESLGAAPIRYLVHRCDDAVFRWRPISPEETELSMMVIDHVGTSCAACANDTGTASEKYEAAAKVSEWRGADLRHAAELLRAAWCCVDEEDVKQNGSSNGSRGGSKRRCSPRRRSTGGSHS